MINSKTKLFLEKLNFFIHKFSEINSDYKKGIISKDINFIIEEYSSFILDKENKKLWEILSASLDNEISSSIDKARNESSYSICIMEKIRAKSLLEQNRIEAKYFDNIENSIKNEFKVFDITNNSKVLFIGVGAFPMTPMYIFRNTGASVVGLDIDREAILLSNKIIKLFDMKADIKLSLESYKDLNFVKEATHIIIASTIKEKYKILEELYSLTNKNVVVSMRYGNGLKSLFNYPLMELKKGTWQLVEKQVCENRIFDVAIYKK